MSVWWLAFIVASLLAMLGGFIWVVVELHKQGAGPAKSKNGSRDLAKDYSDIAQEDVNHLFNNEFREELRNRGRLRFEQIISENAMFLKQDLNATTAQLNETMKHEITAKLQEEFTAYAKAMKDAQELALAALQKTATEVDAQRVALSEALKKDVAEREAVLITSYETNMAQIIEHYVLQTLGDQFDLKSQLPYIIAQMEANKQNIIEDMRL